LFNKTKIDAVYEFKKMSVTDMRKCLRLFGSNAENSGAELVENELFKIIEANPGKFLDKWINNKDRELEVVIERAISKNIIRKNKNVYKFGGDIIAYSTQECIDFLSNPKNQDIKMSILDSIDAKEYIVEGDAPVKDLAQFSTEETKGTKEEDKIDPDVPEVEPVKKAVKKKKISTLPGLEEDEEAVDLFSVAPGPESE